MVDGVRNVLSGYATNAVQANQINGDLHFHGVRSVRVPRMVPPESPYFTNQSRVLAEADQAWQRADPRRPLVMVFSGLPGVGKTEVARKWLGEHADEFPDGHFAADLAAVERDGLEGTVLGEFLLEAGYEPGTIPATASGRASAFRSWSADKRIAVIVDKALSPPQVRMFTPGGGRSVVVVTATGGLSGLGISEQAVVVNLAPLEDAASWMLLTEIIGQERTSAEPEAVAALAGFCAGLPIALCVAGSTIKHFPHRRIGRYVRELEDQKRRLAVLSKEAGLSVSAVFDAAYERLGESARICYHLLGVHPGSGDVHPDTIAAVVGANAAGDGVDELISAKLVQESAKGRLSMHTLVRLHASQRTDDPDLLARVLAHYHHVGVAAGHAMMPQRPWRDMFVPELARFDALAPAKPRNWLVAERSNLLSVVERAVEAGHPDYAWELALLLWPLHEWGKYHADLAAAGRIGAEAARAAGRDDLVAILLTQQAFAEMHGGRPEAAVPLGRESLDVARGTGNRDLIATAVETLGLAFLGSDDRERAGVLLRENLEFAEGIGIGRRVAVAKMHLAKCCAPDEAIELLSAARAEFGAETMNVAKCDLLLGTALFQAGRYEDAVSRCSDALTAMRMLGRPFDEAQILTLLGRVAAAQGNDDTAADGYRQALQIAETFGYEPLIRELRNLLAS
ncbi:tetratricopeptide repeat protein [Actinokineospora inagensis]|uniref:tetratricopeptide repeat protein n=1 Tax=Actinokineospora inagensis TaxID=103730 RepID=UPI00041949E6|nr:tetratricopeptide repeat protein [Actinokineospora inagensis]